MPTSDFFGRKFSFFWDVLGKYKQVKACFSIYIYIIFA
jgi:hypothetical protein